MGLDVGFDGPGWCYSIFLGLGRDRDFFHVLLCQEICLDPRDILGILDTDSAVAVGFDWQLASDGPAA